MGMLASRFYEIAVSAKQGDRTSIFLIFLYFASLMFLAPAGAVLDRWHFHRRVANMNADWSDMANGCLFNPLIYFGIIAILNSIVTGMLLRFIYGDAGPGEPAKIVAIVINLTVAILQTFLVYRYFTQPSRDPRSRFMLGPASEALGTICIFLNMLLFQVMWNVLALGFERPRNVYDIFTSLLALMIGSLIIYFPPRIFYLAEDVKNRRTWIFIVLANLPVLYRALVGNAHALRF
jgi:hypothetical protein